MAIAEAAMQPGDALWDPSWVEGDGERTIRERSGTDAKAAAATLYCSWFCPFAQRAWIALEAKGVAYRYVEINPYEVDPAKPGGYTKLQLPMEEKRAKYLNFVLASPRGLVPALDVRGGERLCESLPLVEFIDERFDGPSLLPRGELHAYARAQCRRWASEFDQRVQRPYYLCIMEQDPERAEAFKESMILGCRSFSRAMCPHGPFFLGSEFSFVEAAAAPFWQRIVSVGAHYRGLELPGDDDDDFKRLRVWWAAVEAHPSVAKTLVCPARLIASYGDYARNDATSDYAKQAQRSLSAPNDVVDLGEDSEFAQIVAAARVKVLRVFGLLAGAFALGYAAGRRRAAAK